VYYDCPEADEVEKLLYQGEFNRHILGRNPFDTLTEIEDHLEAEEYQRRFPEGDGLDW
jgi:hypothetical protein